MNDFQGVALNHTINALIGLWQSPEITPIAAMGLEIYIGYVRYFKRSALKRARDGFNSYSVFLGRVFAQITTLKEGY